MENQTFVTREELMEFMKELESIKSTIEILNDKDMMEQLRESERLKKIGAPLRKIL